MTSQKIKLRFGEVISGWLAISLQAGDIELQEFVSYTPNDVLGELIDAAIGVLAGTHIYTVIWHLEPVEVHLLFRPTPEGTELTIEEWRDNRRGITEPTLIYHAVLDPYDTATAIWRGLRELESRREASGYAKEWRRPFPSSALARLRDSLDKHSNTSFSKNK